MKKKINKLIDIFIVIVIIFCVFNIINSAVHIFEWKKDGDEINKQIDNIIEIAKIKEVDEEKKEVEIIKQEEEIPEYDPYWAYVGMNMIEVDFFDLKEVNKDTVGWIQVNGTNINYPFVQTKDNKYYLTHAFDKSNNSAGWVFLDYRNKSDFTDKHNIIYAHGRYDKTMFGTLRNALTNGRLKNKNNFVFKISTPYENSLWQVFSIYHIPTTSDYLQIKFKDDEEFNKFTKMLIDRSAHKFDTKVGSNDKLLTLSTCYNETERVVLHAKLIKREVRK